MKSKFTLITGGSEGIGFELAKLFASENNNIFLVARSDDKLNKAKEYLDSNYDVDVITMSLDLSVDNSCEKLFRFVEENNLFVDNLINNAGIGSFGFFHEEKDGFEDKIIALNINSLTKITKYFLRDMVKRKSGGILNVASTASFVGGPKMALYYATKSYVLTLTEAIHDEVSKYGVRVSCLCPGPVRTSFQDKAGIKKTEGAKKYLMSAKDVASIGFSDYKKGKTIIIPGIKNKILVLGNKLIPRALSRKIVLKSNK